MGVTLNDPRLQITAYIAHHSNHRFYEVVDTAGGMIILEDCKTMHRSPFAPREIVACFDLVRGPVTVPDSLDKAA